MKRIIFLLFAAVECIFISSHALGATKPESMIGTSAAAALLDENYTNATLAGLHDGKYFAMTPAVSIMFVKKDDTIRGILYRPNYTRGHCIFGAINNTTRMDIFEINSLYVWLKNGKVVAHINGDNQSFDLDSMEIDTKNEFEERYAATQRTLWQDIWAEYTDCHHFFSMLYL